MGNLCTPDIQMDQQIERSSRKADQSIFDFKSLVKNSDMSFSNVEESWISKNSLFERINQYRSKVQKLREDLEAAPPQSMFISEMYHPSEKGELLLERVRADLDIKPAFKEYLAPNIKTHGPVFYEIERSTFRGCFSKGQRNGLGISIYEDGSLYYGLWKDDKRHGIGAFIFHDSELFIGEFINDFPPKKRG